MAQQTLSDEDELVIANMYIDGRKFKEIVRVVPRLTSKDKMYNILYKHKVEIRPSVNDAGVSKRVDKNKVVEEYLNNVPYRLISEAYRISEKTVVKILQDHDIERNRRTQRSLSVDDEMKLIEMYDGGKSIIEIMAAFPEKITEPTKIYKTLRRYGRTPNRKIRR